MPRFLIEVPHAAEDIACTQVVDAFMRTGSHFLTHADWGCKDGVHKAWIIAEVDSRTDAESIVPADFRGDQTVVQLNCFTVEELEELKRHHGLP